MEFSSINFDSCWKLASQIQSSITLLKDTIKAYFY